MDVWSRVPLSSLARVWAKTGSDKGRVIVGPTTEPWSGGTLIPNIAWAESKEYKLKFPTLDDRIMFVHNGNFWLTAVNNSFGKNRWELVLKQNGSVFHKEKVN